MYIRRFICSLLIFTLLFAFNLESAVVSAEEMNFLKFTYVSNRSGYSVDLDANYMSMNPQKDLNIPETYDDKINGEASVVWCNDSLGLLSDDNFFESIRFPKGFTETVNKQFRRLKSLKDIYWLNKDSLNLVDGTFRDASNSIANIYIYASNVNVGASAFRTLNTNLSAKIHVTSQAVKDDIVEKTKTGS